MTSLDEARDWYVAAKRQYKLVHRLGSRHWNRLPWEDMSTSLGRDARLREQTSDGLLADADTFHRPLDDLAVVVMFSVFEAVVRDTVLAGMAPEIEALRHPALRHAAEDAKEGVERGSFFRILDALKTSEYADLIEQVDQVREYRNWVAHGRRADRPATVTPDAAYERLSNFLEVLPAVTASEVGTQPSVSRGE